MEKLNIAEILKDCPSGMELDCTVYDNVTFGCIMDGNCYPIQIQTPEGNMLLSEYGCMSLSTHSKCVIFPKGKTTWEGFQRPFKDGDIVATESGKWIGITTGGIYDESIPTYCIIDPNNSLRLYFDKPVTWSFNRLATEEEKEKLFQAIKDNGYKWNEETKTLEKLPKFKVKYIEQELIEKACEWFSKALDNFYIGTQQANFTDKVKFIESFKKAMRNNYETLGGKR